MDTSGLIFPKPASRYSVKKEQRARDMVNWAETCKAVDQRDGRRCRACGRRADLQAIGIIDRAHRHHIIYRSAGGPDASWNVLLVCAGCHFAQHDGLIDIRGNADTGIEVWKNGAHGWFMEFREVAPHQRERD